MLLEAGAAQGHIAAVDATEAYRTLYGLIVRDAHGRWLLGQEPEGAEADFAARANLSVDQFLTLFPPDAQNTGRPAG